MRIRRINKTIYEKNYSTDNIIQVVLNAYEYENDSQISDLAQELKGSNDTETCRNIWQYLIDNIRYVADGIDQDIKSPARLVHDGVGDCKSFSIFTACILRELGVSHFFRFVSYTNKKEATHVYVVAYINNNELPIDAVAQIQARTAFGNEINYTYRADMKQIGRIRYLAGLGDKAAIGTTPSAVQEYLNSDAFKVWTNDETEADLTRAKGYLLAEWDGYWISATYAQTAQERIEALNRLQYIGAMLRTYNELRHDNELLARAGRAFSHLIKNAVFDSNEPDPQKRTFFSDTENNEVQRLIAMYDQLPDSEFTALWNREIVQGNRRYVDDNGAAIGAVDINTLRTNLKQTGGYYIYSLGLSDSQALAYSTNSAIRKKRTVQAMLLNKNKTVNNVMSSAETEKWISNGCSETWKASTPQAAFNSLKTSVNGAKIGDVTAVLAIISTIITLIGKIISWFKKSEVPSDATVNSGLFNPSDLPGGSGSGSGTGSGLNMAGTSWLLPLLLVGGFFMVKKPKKQSKKQKK